MSLVKLLKATQLPKEWDNFVGQNVYLKRDFLTFVEKTEQKEYSPQYYLFYDKDKLDSAFVCYKRKKYNLGMFTKVKLAITVTLIYFPMCVTEKSIIIGKLKQEVLSEIKKIKGFKMVLNLPDSDMEDFAVGKTCPKCILQLNFSSFEDYLKKLRSDYRNRYKKVLNKTKDFTIEYITSNEFTDQHYQMYLNTLNKSKIKIETLSKEYFLGEQFVLFDIKHNGNPVGFIQLLPNGKELIFEFVGIDYRYNTDYPIYHRLLLEIVKYGIENKFSSIDFGQTADEIKLKLGGSYVYLYAALHSSNKMINFLCKKIAPKIEYKPVTTKFNVFKENL